MNLQLGKLPQEKKLSRRAVLTLVNHGIYQFGNALSLIFVNLYLWRLTKDLTVNGAFNLIALLSAPVATILVGKIAKKRDRLTAYRLGIFSTAFFYLCILIAQEHMVKYYMLFAVLKGASTAFYWLGYFTLIFDVSDNANRHRYLGWNQIIMNSTNVLGPALAGVLIAAFSGLRGYDLVFLLAFLMFFAAAFLSLRMEKAPLRRRRYDLKYLPLILRKRKGFAYTLAGWFIVGLPQGIMMYIPQILLYQVFPSEKFVGYMNVLFFGLTVASSYLYSRTASARSTGLFLIVAAAGFALSSSILLVQIALWSVVLFMSTNSMFKPLQQNAYAAHYYAWIDRLPLKKNFRVESIVVRETIINLGRATGVLVMMAAAGNVHAALLPWILFGSMLAQMSIPILIRKGGDASDGSRTMGGRRTGREAPDSSSGQRNHDDGSAFSGRRGRV